MESTVSNHIVGRGRGRGRGRARNLEQRQCSTITEEDNPAATKASSLTPEVSGLFADIPSKSESLSSVEQTDTTGQKETYCYIVPTGGKVRSNVCSNNVRESSKQVGMKVLPIKINSFGFVASTSTISSPPVDSSEESSSKSFRKCPLSYFLPTYFECTKPSQRLNILGSSPVKVLKVLDNRGNLCVAFQDKDSLTRFNCLLQHMGRFYSSPEGLSMLKPGKYLQNGEIVAAIVSMCSEVPVYRRVQVQKILEGEGCFKKAFAVDIDNLSHWNIRTAFALHHAFHNHPSQACRIRIRNYKDLYPKGIFEELFDDHERFLKVMNELSYTFFASMIGRSLYVSNISVSNENGKEMITAEVNLDVNWRFRTIYMELFKNYFTPVTPEIGEVYRGRITDVLTNGTLGICLKDSLFEPIDRILNEHDTKILARDVVGKDKNELLKTIGENKCKIFIGLNEDTRRVCRIFVQSIYGDKLKVVFMDTGRETFLNIDDLICVISDYPKISSILCLVPPQAIRFQLFGICKLSPEQCQYLNQMEVNFKVCNNLNVHNDLLEVEIIDPHSSTFTLNYRLASNETKLT